MYAFQQRRHAYGHTSAAADAAANRARVVGANLNPMTLVSNGAATKPRRRTAGGGQIHDVVIVGGGTAGAVLATRISERADRRVLLIEAGPAYAPWEYPSRIAASENVGDMTGIDWGFRTEPGYLGRPIAAFCGKVLGGSSAMGGGVAIRGRRQDFRNWNLPGWAFEDLMPSYRLLEDSASNDARLHSKGGPVPARQMTLDELSPTQRAFVDAALANGYVAIHDFDGLEVNGVGPCLMNVVNGVRENTGMTYLTNEVRDRPNLLVRGCTMADAVVFSGKQAIGVRLAGGEMVHAGEIILSAGAYGSAAILLRSGIGPRRDLEQLGIPVLADLPVGQSLKDHPLYCNAYAADPDRIGRQSPVIGAQLWTHSSTAEKGDMDLQVTATHLFPARRSPTGAGFALAVALTRPRSVGRVWLTSRDPSAAPKIDLGFLADPLDRARMMEGVRLARTLGRTAPLANIIASEIAPGIKAETDKEVQASINATLETYHHPTSTAPMGLDHDPRAVVDLQGNVRGVGRLRVVDASIFPDTISVATGLTVIAVAEHVASLMD